MKPNLKNINKSTPAKLSKLGLAFTSISALIAGYSLTVGDKIVGYIGLGTGIFGTFITTLFSEDK